VSFWFRGRQHGAIARSFVKMFSRRIFSSNVFRSTTTAQHVEVGDWLATLYLRHRIYPQCPFQTATGIRRRSGVGPPIFVSLEAVISGRPVWEMQLKGAGRTPYCDGADGRAVLRRVLREVFSNRSMKCSVVGVQSVLRTR